MNLAKEIVHHVSFGKGRIKSVKENYVKVDFGKKIGEKTFQYPGAFEIFLKAESVEAQEVVHKDIEVSKVKMAFEMVGKELKQKEEDNRLAKLTEPVKRAPRKSPKPKAEEKKAKAKAKASESSEIQGNEAVEISDQDSKS